MTEGVFFAWLMGWLGCAAAIFAATRKDRNGAGLVVSYVLQLWLIHWLAAALYVLPWYGPPDLATSLGLQESTYAIAAFAFGAVVIVPAIRRSRPASTLPAPADPWLERTYLVTGLLAFFVVEPAVHHQPTVGAIASALANLLLIALGMRCWNAYHDTRRGEGAFWRSLSLTTMLPFASIVIKGYLGLGSIAMMTVFAFVASFYRPRWKLVGCALIASYFALSLYVTYMRDRAEIRNVVWGEEAYSARLSKVFDSLATFEFFDHRNVEHLYRIDLRMNQNTLVGHSVLNLQTHPDLFARGRTIWEALLSPIPRVLWPDKPMASGSGDLVSEFTGLRFQAGTAVGIGHIMELYVNFSTTGLVIGMIVLGVAIGWLDRSAAERMYAGDWPGLVLRWLPALGLLQVGGSLVDAVSAAAALLAAASIIQRIQPRRTYPGVRAPGDAVVGGIRSISNPRAALDL